MKNLVVEYFCLFVSKKCLRIIFGGLNAYVFLSSVPPPSLESFGCSYTTWPGDVHTLLLGASSFVALMLAGLKTSARGPLGIGSQL